MKPIQFLLFLLVTPLLQAQMTVRQLDGTELITPKINRIVEKLLVYGNVDGICIAIINKDKAFIKPFGHRDASSKKFLDPDTVFPAGALGEGIVAYLTVQLASEQLIDLDQPLQQYVSLESHPEWASVIGDPRWSKVTLRQCLSHTTGLPDSRWIDPTNAKVLPTPQLKFYADPGSRYAFSGEGLRLLQLALETKTGKTLEVLAQERVFSPFGMTRSGFSCTTDWKANLALPHDAQNQPIRGSHSEPAWPGSFYTSMNDCVRFTQKLLLNRLPDPRLRDQLIEPQIAIFSRFQFPTMADAAVAGDATPLSYGLGFGLVKNPYGRAYFTEARMEGIRHYTISFPDKNFAVVLMSNCENGDSIFAELLDKLAGDTYSPCDWEGFAKYRYEP